MSQSSCAAIFEVGKDYLVFANKINEILQVTLCGRSKQLTDATEELQYLSQWEKGKTPTEIIGTIYLNDTSLDSKKYNRVPDKEIVHIYNKNQYLSNVKVNPDGNFSARVPYPGIYTIKATVPNWFDQQAIRKINVPLHGCASTFFSLNPDGQITGTVLDADGSPAKHLTLKIIENNTGSTLESKTNQYGVVTFRGVQSGNYQLGVNIDTFDNPSSETPYPPTIYPGKQNTSLIKVRDFEKVKLTRIFQLPKRGTLRTIEVLVTLEDGSPLSGASLSCTPVGKNYWKKDLTNKYGKISFTGINNTEYIVDAYISSDHPLASKGYQIAQWVKVPKSDGTTHIHLVFKKK